MKKGNQEIYIIIIGIIIVLIVAFLIIKMKNDKENFKIYGGTPTCPYRTDESCPWVKEGTGPACQIKEDHAGCPACCGNIDWYLGPQKYSKKCPGKVPPAFEDVKDYYASLQENFTSRK